MSYTPNVIDRWLHVAQFGYPAVNRRYIGRFGMAPKVIVLHIQDGNNWGSWQWFHTVSASSTVLIGKTGEIWRLVPEEDGPWTNGNVNQASAVGWEIYNRFGADPNVYSLTIETEGRPGDVHPEAQIQAIVWQIWTWMKRYNIPLRFVVRHADFDSITRPNCPGNTLYAEVARRLQAMEVPSEPVYAKPATVMLNGAKWDGSTDVKVNTAVFHGEVQTVAINKDGAPSRLYANFSSQRTAANFKLNQDVKVLGWVRGEARNGENRWWITSNFGRLWVGYTDVKPRGTAESDPDPLPGGAFIRDGLMYIPAQMEDRLKRVKIVKRANVRALPSLDAPVQAVVDAGEEIRVPYWTFGDVVNGSKIWWVLHNSSTDDIEGAQYLWAAATNTLPEDDDPHN